MTLPLLPLPAATLEIHGQTVAYHSLSRADALHLQQYAGDIDAQDNFVIACGFGVTEDEARAWRASVTFADAQIFSDAILVLSGLAVEEPEEEEPVNPK
jgi:hypothetical protein